MLRGMKELQNQLLNSVNSGNWEDSQREVTAINKFFKLNNLNYRVDMGIDEDENSEHYGEIWWMVNKT